MIWFQNYGKNWEFSAIKERRDKYSALQKKRFSQVYAYLENITFETLPNSPFFTINTFVISPNFAVKFNSKVHNLKYL
jgi:hypothetical protein